MTEWVDKQSLTTHMTYNNNTSFWRRVFPGIQMHWWWQLNSQQPKIDCWDWQPNNKQKNHKKTNPVTDKSAPVKKNIQNTQMF